MRSFLRAAAAIVFCLAEPCMAADPFYRGAWTIEKFAPAPFGRPFDHAGQLVGERVVFAARSISGPGVLACRSPRYALFKVPVEGLFQGTLGDRQTAAKAAARLGILARRIPTVSTGCEHAIDFHFTSGRTAVFALDNAIYYLRKIE